MPYVTEVPTTIDIDHLETPSPLNPLGIKGAGEAGVIPSAAVFAAAIEDAEGFPITAMPISPSELFALRLEHADDVAEATTPTATLVEEGALRPSRDPSSGDDRS